MIEVFPPGYMAVPDDCRGGYWLQLPSGGFLREDRKPCRFATPREAAEMAKNHVVMLAMHDEAKRITGLPIKRVVEQELDASQQFPEFEQ